MDFSMSVISGLSVGIAFLTGLIRLKKADPSFIPFIALMGAGLANELIGLWLINRGNSNAVSFNIYLLVSALLLCRQFRNWGLVSNKLYYVLWAIVVAGWTCEFFLSGRGRLYYSWFIIGQSVLIILLSAEQVSKVLFDTGYPLLRNPVFFICTGLLIFYTYSLLVEIFWLDGLNQSRVFKIYLNQIVIYSNLFVNLLYAFAILWIPLKRRYIMGY